MPDLVECRSDDQYAQRPTAIYWDGVRLAVDTVLAEWRTPEDKGFRVLTKDFRVFDVFFNQAQDRWKIQEA